MAQLGAGSGKRQNLALQILQRSFSGLQIRAVLDYLGEV
jgi:hypothetical protein